MELFVVANRATKEVVGRFNNKMEAKAKRNELCGPEELKALKEDNFHNLPFVVSKGKDHRLTTGA